MVDRPEIVFENVALKVGVPPSWHTEGLGTLSGGASAIHEHRCGYAELSEIEYEIVGTVSPPFGYTIFYFAGLGHKNVSIGDIYKAGITFAVFISIILLLCVIFPQIPLWLPSLMIK